MKILFTLLLQCLLVNVVFSQGIPLPYYTGFDNASEQAGWIEYQKAEVTFCHWGSGYAYSLPNGIGHSFAPSSGIILVDNWYVSPAFSISNGGKLDSIRYMFSGYSQPVSGDTIAIYLLNGSQDPSLASSKLLLFDFRNSEYIINDTFRIKTNITLPSLSGLSYLAIRYRNADCSTKWLTVNFDNIAISGNSVGINEFNTSSAYKLNIYPNPFSTQTTLHTYKALKDATLSIYNLVGQQVKQINNINGQTIALHRNNLPKGLYFIQLMQDNKIITTNKFEIVD